MCESMTMLVQKDSSSKTQRAYLLTLYTSRSSPFCVADWENYAAALLYSIAVHHSLHRRTHLKKCMCGTYDLY
jgi:hypothetical protein